ncbi:uncharacterized protein PV09_00006 [Verruconis gallopava]|uniref:non-specific serine/threonine protein kinase n=1 Tax=Verruconis gallopava TaxID=253628 RepID=A0A0D1Z7Z4_9PEZI|nr:uncharacterized protein PV09_00006 [Verruconis gallopava]KIW09057.1 hypothetical protein PV09_00006 [Verruconis gallopava]
MAPKAAKNKNKQNGTKQSPVAAESEGLPAGTTDYAQQQNDEIEVLRSIYMDDFCEVETKTAWANKQSDKAFKLRLRPMMHSDVEVAITLSVCLTATYPRSLPTLKFLDVVNIRPSTLGKLEEFIKNRPKQLLGEVMIYELASSIQDMLEDEAQFKAQGNAMPSLEEQRVAQEAATTQLAKQQEEEARQRQQQAQAEEDRMLRRMVEDEMNRRRELRKKMRPVYATHSVATGNSIATVELDRTVSYQAANTSLEFTAVTAPVPLSAGPLTEVSTVQPVIRAEGPEKSCLLVVKQLSLEFSSNVDKKKILALEDELETLRKINHTNVAQILDFRVDFGDKWSIMVLMEFARKGSLGEQLVMIGALPPARVRIWLVELLEALDHLHRNGIVHKRIHPNNVLLVQPSHTSPLQVRLADVSFQAALYDIKAGCTQKPSVSSFSAYWNPPETNDKTRKTDIWELGIVFLQMLFGLDTPRKYSSPNALIENLSLSNPLEDLIRKFFRTDAKRRPTAFDLIPSEFLRTDAEIYADAVSPAQSRHGSMILTQVPSQQRLRRGSSGYFGAMYSRYAQEWIEIGRLGRGGFGEVVKARNKMDGGIYAIKKIKQKTGSKLSEVLSEVMLLSRLNHPYVVRYYTAWPEEDFSDIANSEDSATIATTTDDGINSTEQIHGNTSIDIGQSRTGDLDFISSGFPKIQFGAESDDDSEDDFFERDDDASAEDIGEDYPKSSNSFADRDPLALRRTSSSRNVRSVASTLYIQMEYCERQTLRDLIRKEMDDEEIWRLFRQIVEGLVHIHGHGIIHRDLKPDNIFIDLAGNPKIGDFGLATSGQYQLADKTTSSGRQTGGDMTRSIGTTYYVAPELRSNASGAYNDKVDMYSLGIIFFEMNVPLKTAMERDKAIRSIREREHNLPSILETPEKAIQGSIILSLVSHKPSERPSSSELLSSGKIPLKIEDETIRRALEGLSDPTSPYYHQLMTALFSQTASKQIKDYTWDLGTMTGMHDANENMLLMRNLVKDHLISIFQRHGAVETQRQQILPRSAHYANNNVVQLLDASGTLVQLPYDLILPHARAIARKYPATDKSFAFGNVFRETVIGGAPQTSGEVDFDIVSHDALDLALKEAEVIKVLDEILEEFPGIAVAPMCFHLNHADLLELIMDFCRISIPQRQAVKEQISKLNILDFDWVKIRNELRSPALAVSSTSLDSMSRFDFRDTPDKAISKINAIFEGTVYADRAKASLKHIRDVVGYLQDFGVRHKIFISPLSAINEKFYSGGLLFQCLFDRKKRAVLAAGGRYDRLIEEHKPKVQGMFTGCHAVGFNLSWDRLVVAMDKLLNSKSKATSFLKRDKAPELTTAWKTRRCDVLVAAFDDVVLRTAGLRVLSELWANNISAELATNAHTLEEIMSKHRDDSHGWIVIIKPDSVAGGRPDLRVRTAATREDIEVKAENLVSHLLSELRERDSAEGKGRYHRRQLAHASEQLTTTSNRRQNVQVLVSQHRSKKSNKWNIIEAVQSRAQELLSSYSNSPIAAVETRDDILEMVRATRLSDPESWRKVVHSVPVNERDYVQQIHQLLDGFRREWQENTLEKSRTAFLSNFRTGYVMLYDLGL